MTSFNMPPGCSVRDIPGYDAPDFTWEMQHHCSACGCWLPLKPDASVAFCAVRFCDGKVKEWTDEYDERICEIIGMEHLGEKHTVGFSVACREDLLNDNPGDHAPHFFEDYLAYMCDENVYTCRHCGHDNHIAE